jgi:L-seryl-tRNA(Ser) seleniumtransferase
MVEPAESVVHGSLARPEELPATDRLLQTPVARTLVAEHGHTLVAGEARTLLAALRARAVAGALGSAEVASQALDEALADRVRRRLAPRLRPVLNLTGTVIHTNLGRAPLARSAIARLAATAGEPVALEYDLQAGGRGDRDRLVEALLCELTGAEAATVVNNNAAAVLLVIAALAGGREAIVSRGELVEIGGAFRMPDVMAAAGATLVEVGTTNRTHPRDYERAIGARTALLMKVHTSNYVVQGFTSTVDEATLAAIAHARSLPLASDLGSGALVDLSAWGLPREPLVRETVAAGCDVVTFSGDKLLGGPQAGLIVGTRTAIDAIRTHPLKRALRLSKLPLAALEATLALYLRPERLSEELPVLRLMTRPAAELRARAEHHAPALAAAVAPAYAVTVEAMAGQIGSGSLPVDRLASAGWAIAPVAPRGTGRALQRLERALRELPVPVIGRIESDRLLLDVRGLDEPAPFLAQLGQLAEALA